MATEMSESNAAKFCQLWAEQFAAVLQQMGVPAVRATSVLSSAPGAAAAPGDISARFLAGGGLEGEVCLRAQTSAALTLAQVLMAESLEPGAAFSTDHKDAFLEFIRQAAGLTATAWRQSAGVEATLTFHSAPEPPFSASASANILLSGEKLAETALVVSLNADLVRSVEAPVAKPAPPPAVTAPAPPAAESFPPNANLDLLLDVELEATIRFGEREMLLREVLGLLPGAVVELNQVVNEPADLLVAGRLVARGEVVVVDGNFGLRITEVASKSKRASLVPF